MFDTINEFVCKLYGVHNCANTDEARYKKFVSGKTTPEPQKLPPTKDALLCHLKRVTYATAMIKKSLEATFQIPSPHEKGWFVNDDTLEIQWMLRDPAPADVLQLLTCGCKKSKCSNGSCMCRSHGLKCSSLCTCNSCENSNSLSDTDTSGDESDDDLESDDEDDDSE